MTAIILLLAISLFSSSAIAQTIYKWKDDKGQWHFSQTAPIGEKSEKMDLPTDEARELKNRAEWQRFYALFRDAKYRMDRPNPHTNGLKGLIATSEICQLQESLSAILLNTRQMEKADQIRESARVCAREAEAAFPAVFQRAQKELSTTKPTAAEALRAYTGTWLAIIRTVPRLERPDLLSRRHDEDKKLLRQKEADLDMELLR